jgi:hypothetical protein
MTNSSDNDQFGLWSSPISPTMLARGITFSDTAWDHNGYMAWREMRGDRGVIVLQPADGQAARDLNDEYSVRAKVGYGGGDFTCGHGYVFLSRVTRDVFTNNLSPTGLLSLLPLLLVISHHPPFLRMVVGYFSFTPMKIMTALA